MKILVNRLLRAITICALFSGLLFVNTPSLAGAVSQLYSVVFWANSPGSLATTSQTSSVAQPLDAFSSMGFSNSNYVFLDWNTQSNGGGTSYPDQSTYPFTSDLTLFAQWVQVFHAVTFYANTAIGDTTHRSQSGNSPSSLTSISTLNFSKANFTFSDWNSQATGGGSSFGDQATYSFATDLALFAQWRPDSETLTFSPNTGSGSVSPLAAPFESYVSIPSGSPLAKANWSFTGWNTKPDGSGNQLPPGAIILMPTSETLYAQWSLDTETILFSANSGSGSVSPLVAKYGTLVTLPSGSSLSKSRYSFTGWNTLADGSGTQYSPGSVLQIPLGETLFATWAQDTFVVTFVSPNKQGQIAPVSTAAGGGVTLGSPSNSIDPGFSFAGWYTSRTGGQLVGKGGSTYLPTGSVTLYEVWTPNPEVSLKFADNGGTGVVKARAVRSGLRVTVPSGSGLHRKGFTFRGWSRRAKATLPDVKIGVKILLTSSRTLYAVWRRDLAPSTPRVLLGSVGTFAPNSSSLTPAMRHYISSLALGIDRHGSTVVFVDGYCTSRDSSHGAAQLSLRRAKAVKTQLQHDLADLNDVGVVLHASGEARLSNSVLASFRKVEVFAN